MADTSGMAEIRGIDIQKAVQGYADQSNIFKQFLRVTPTSAREIRWYKKGTTTFLDTTDTTGITASQIANVAELALPDVVEQSFTRLTSYVRKYFVESPWISEEDIKDCDPDILAFNIKDLTMAVENQVDIRIYGLLSASAMLSGAALGTGWNDTTNGNPIMDLLSGSMAIRSYGYPVENIVCLIHPTAYRHLINYIVTVKGSMIPNFSSEKVENGVLSKIAGNKIVVSENCTTAYAVQLIPNVTASWKTFTPISSAKKIEEGIGVKIRIWEEGECLVEHPYALHAIRGVVQ